MAWEQIGGSGRPRIQGIWISHMPTPFRPLGLRQIAHPYPDAFPTEGTVRCSAFDELFAEKIRAMAQRGRPRDLYDIVNLFRRNDLRMFPDAIRSALGEKCDAKGIVVPTAADFAESPVLFPLFTEVTRHAVLRLT